MLFRANAKINLGLRIIDKRPDGYHNIQSIFYPIRSLYDDIIVEKGNRKDHFIDITINGNAIDCTPQENLIFKCYHLLARKHPKISSVHVSLIKRIPTQAGLGGGSSDCATMALALNSIFDLNLTTTQLKNTVKNLGADCPFFIINKPCFVQGIGDILQPINLNLTGLKILIVKPNISISTKNAYNHISPYAEQPLWPSFNAKPEEILKKIPHNDFEPFAFQQCPELSKIKNRLLLESPLHTAMSGSGSAMFAIFHAEKNVKTITDSFINCNYFIHESTF